MSNAISIAILANASKAKSEINSVADTAEKSTGRLRSSIGKAGKYIALGLGAGLVGAAAAGVKFAQAAIEDEQSANKMAQTFTRAAGATKQQIAATEDWITAQGKSLGVADDELRPALSRLVTATGDVSEAQKLASLAMDVSAGTGKSLEQVSTALMKAQNGQVAGLARLGINTKNAAGETISMAEATQRMSSTFGGAAQANANTLGGRIDRLKLIASEAGETIGSKMLPYLTTFATFLLTKGVPAVMEIGGQVKDWATTMATALAPTIATVAAFVTGTLVPGLVNLVGVVQQNKDIVIAAAAGLGVAVTALGIYNTVTKIVTASTAAWNVVQKLLNGSLKANPVGLVVTAIGLLAAGMVLAYNKSETFRGIVDKVGNVLKNDVLPVVGKFAGILAGVVVTSVSAAVSVVGTIIRKVIDFGAAVIDGAQKVGEFASKVKDKIADVVGFFTALPDKITGALSGAKTLLVETGKNIVQGLVNGINDAKQWVIDKVSELADLVPNWVKKRLGIASPSKVTRQLGRWTGQGLADGIASIKDKVADAAEKTAEKAIERLKAKLDDARGVKESITSLRDSIASSLTGSLFSGAGDEESTALDKFRASLTAAKQTAKDVSDAVKKLLDTKVSNGFLNNLIQSGNTDLIVQLAGAPDLNSLAAQYDAVIKQNEDTGRLVAEQVVGTRLDAVNDKISGLVQELRDAREQDRAEKREPVKVTLTAEQTDRITRGREIQMDLDAYRGAGGRIRRT